MSVTIRGATGLTFMDTPGFDPISVTGLVARGATVVRLTTGRGSVPSRDEFVLWQPGAVT